MDREAYLVALAVGSGLSLCAEAAELVGRASVIDGDTIEIYGRRTRLHGIDAPESRQLCEAHWKQHRCEQKRE